MVAAGTAEEEEKRSRRPGSCSRGRLGRRSQGSRWFHWRKRRR